MKNLIVLFCAMAVSSPLFAGDDRPIGVDKFPVPAKEFINKHFKNVQVSLSTVDREILDTTYEVFFANGCKVEFDRSGNWKDIDCKHGRVPEEAIPEAIRNYINANHKGHYVTEIDRDNRDYEMKLDNRLELEFNLQFQLIGIDN
ncbi:MAG: PepSY-like domain-containing protein [Bacteroidales bacterium]|jgi:hypothetical protein|nr:PepSY-like domain-containing protein [Bacteroidales bacterium]